VQHIADGPAKRVGTLAPQQETDRPAIEDLLGRSGAGLEPLHVEPPTWHEGLRPVAFGDGLDEITVQALRAGPGRASTPRDIAHTEALRLAAKRADALGRLG